MMSLVHEKLAMVMKGLSHIPKQRSQGVSYEFRSVDAVFNELHGLLADNGLTLRPQVLDDWQLNMIPGTKDRVQAQALFRLAVYAQAEDGSEALLGTGLCQSHDYGDKAVYQAQQNGIKYVLIEAFAIPTGERDMDAREADEVPADEVMPKATNQLKADTVEWLDGDGDLAAKVYQEALEELGLDPSVPIPKSRIAEAQQEVEGRALSLKEELKAGEEAE